MQPAGRMSHSHEGQQSSLSLSLSLSPEEPSMHQASQTLLTALRFMLLRILVLSLALLPRQQLPARKQVPALYNKPLTLCHAITCIIVVEVSKRLLIVQATY